MNSASDQARQSLRDNLLASTDPVAHAAGLKLSATAPAPEVQGCDGDDCAAVTSANASAASAFGRHLQDAAFFGPIAELATLARETRSDLVYGWALQMCGRATPKVGAASAPCADLSARRWADLAPDKAWPWLTLAAEAQAQDDASGVEYAMNRAAHASDWRTTGPDVTRLLGAALPTDIQGLPRMSVMIGVVFELAGESRPYAALSRYCPARQDANRRQACARLAEQMLTHVDNLIDLSIGVRVGERSGLPDARLAPLRAERDALQKSTFVTRVTQAADPAKGCAGLDVVLQYFDRWMAGGELAAMRALLREEAAAE